MKELCSADNAVVWLNWLIHCQTLSLSFSNFYSLLDYCQSKEYFYTFKASDSLIRQRKSAPDMMRALTKVRQSLQNTNESLGIGLLPHLKYRAQVKVFYRCVLHHYDGLVISTSGNPTESGKHLKTLVRSGCCCCVSLAHEKTFYYIIVPQVCHVQKQVESRWR